MTRTYHRGGDPRKVAFGVLVASTAAAYGFWRLRPFRVEIEGLSMSPTLEPRDWAIAFVSSDIRRGDVVVLDHPLRPGFEIVKRLVALPGDTAPDGTPLADEVWVEGDRPDGSTDSRQFGPVPVDLVKARVLLVWWPPKRMRRLRARRVSLA